MPWDHPGTFVMQCIGVGLCCFIAWGVFRDAPSDIISWWEEKRRGR